MAENPDRQHGWLPYNTPKGTLRFVEREIDGRKVRILQVWEYSRRLRKEAWFDVPLMEDTP